MKGKRKKGSREGEKGRNEVGGWRRDKELPHTLTHCYHGNNLPIVPSTCWSGVPSEKGRGEGQECQGTDTTPPLDEPVPGPPGQI